MSRASGGQAAQNNGTPGQVHLTWGDDPATSVVVSWASPGRALRPRVRIGQRVIFAQEKAHVNKATGKTVWCYHARVPQLRPGAAYGYAVTADNDANAGDPFTSTFRTAPADRASFRFTCSGDLAGADYQGAAHVAGAVESLQPLFHLLNGGLCETGRGVARARGTPAASWRAFGNGSQLSAASRPWMPVPGSHEEAGMACYLARYALPSGGSLAAAGRWYSFRVGTAVFACLDGGNPGECDEEGPARWAGDASGDSQTRWLDQTLAAARADSSVDWIIVSAHASREEWLPLFDRHAVDLVLCGHGGDRDWSAPSLTLGHGGNGYAIAAFTVVAGRQDADEATLAASCLSARVASDDVAQWEHFTLRRPRRASPRRPGRSR
jgi:hypothetical protein